MMMLKNKTKQLEELIYQKINNSGGYISFAEFMELALYTPNLGYYSTLPSFGSQGDFVTSSEITSLFAKCMAKQFAQILLELKQGDILEIGAGSGVFAKDVLLALQEQGCLPQHYFIFEPSPSLRIQQSELLQQACPHLLPRVQWLDQLPAKMQGIIFANEVIDAMPVHVFQIKNANIWERGVTWENNQFIWDSRIAKAELAQYVKALQKNYSLSDGYESEVNLNIPSWIKSLSAILERGAILLADYGYGRAEYYHPDRTQGTLMCFYRHQKMLNPFQHIGSQDITAHVDFTHIVENAVEANLTLAGYTTQASYLLACGLTNLSQSQTVSELELYQQNQAIKRLTLPSEMGEIMKMIGFNKNIDISWLGFSLFDRRQDL